jgi:LysM repeat protein
MSKFQKLAQINKIANECAQDGDFVLASKFHNEFMKVAQEKRTYKVTDFKEFLRDIAEKTGVSVMQLKGYNPGVKNVLYEGQTINLGPAPKKDGPGVYTVSQGDSLSSIASRKGISLQMLLKLNPQINPKNVLQPGTKLKVPAMKSSLEESPMDFMAEEMPEMPEM